MHTLLQPLEEMNTIQTARECLSRRRLPIHISGCLESQKVQLIQGLRRDSGWTVVVAADEVHARELISDFRVFDRDVWFYPAKDVIFYSADVHGNALAVERLQAIHALMSRDSGIFVTTMTAAMEQVQDAQVYRRAVRVLREADILELEDMAADLVDMGYERLDQVEQPGQFSIRGGILDIYSPTEECPYRVELWGDEIDTIQSFDVQSQRSIQRVPEITVFPASEIVLDEAQITAGLQKVQEEFESVGKKLLKAKKTEAYQQLTKTIHNWQDTMEVTRGRMGLESFLPYFDASLGSVFDYFPQDDTLFFVDDPGHCREAMDAVEFEFTESMKSRLEQGYILPGQMGLIYGADAVSGMLARKNTVYLTMLDVLPNGISAAQSLALNVQSVPSYNQHFEMLAGDIAQWQKQGFRIVLLSGSRTRGQRLAQDLQTYEVQAFFREEMDVPLEAGQVMVSYGGLRRGFVYPNQKFVVLTETDVFGARKRNRRKKQKRYDGQVIQSFNELHVGDFVVHENHGLGIYRGIEKIKVDGVTKDFIKIEYGDGGNLYVPASSSDVLQKYADKEAAKKPKLNKLNSVEWKKTKSRVRGAVQDIAKELVELYARRQQMKGYQFGPDTVWQQEFEEMFPFEETTDQLEAIAATKKDMESDKIMDRLVCGDVGYGKTEIAIRAAFKAVNDNKQVAFLVPTTILAQQHYNTMLERLGQFPVNVELLSRFRTTTQQKHTIERLKKGEVDIVIGTHRLLSKDVSFKNLGLLIVDEEQRFGVTHKEKIKQMKGNVDVLTLSATPIPRTLHMSLIGIRDMSVLEEPPVDRLPIQTFVMEHNKEIIREAINRELARGGQVYYVYNRVRNIDEVAAEVQRLVPDARVAYAHGQMSERQLEQIMMDFIQGEIEVLIATTIIETGLDISNVNTIIIDNADQMGLSQLYQLRGRVGRSSRTAYAFLMYKRDKMLREVAEKRLSAIREYTDLGSGIKVAMRDLEIRGAGNLLGAAQSGHMEAVGYDLYCKMLNDAVLTMKGLKSPEEEFETTIDLPVDAYIPATYIKSEFQKLDMYKRIAGIETREEMLDMEEEMADRFTEPPKPAVNLLRIALLKAQAHRAGLIQVVRKPDGIRFYLQPNAKIAVEKIPEMIEYYQGRLKFVGKNEPYFLYPLNKEMPKPEELFGQMEQIVDSIRGLAVSRDGEQNRKGNQDNDEKTME